MQLETLYSEFLSFLEENYIKDSPNWTGVEKNVKLSTLKKSFPYRKVTFFEFCNVLRDIYYYHKFLFKKNSHLDIWIFKVILKFLIKKQMVVIKDNKIFLKGFPNVFLPRMDEKQIQNELSKKIKITTKLSFIENLIGDEKFEWKRAYDQIPISLSSSIFLASKIFDYFPIKKKFLIIGDDDFSSILISFLDPSIEITVVDIDSEILSIIERMKKKYNLKNISTEQCDVRYSSLKKEFYGFLTNPPYTISGVKTFFDFGNKAMEEGIAFLIVGDESIRNRFLFLQKFFNSKNFIIRELINEKIYYPFREIFDEDVLDKKEIEETGLKIQKEDYLFASFYVLEKIPWKLKEEGKKGIYNYL